MELDVSASMMNNTATTPPAPHIILEDVPVYDLTGHSKQPNTENEGQELCSGITSEYDLTSTEELFTSRRPVVNEPGQQGEEMILQPGTFSDATDEFSELSEWPPHEGSHSTESNWCANNNSSSVIDDGSAYLEALERERNTYDESRWTIPKRSSLLFDKVESKYTSSSDDEFDELPGASGPSFKCSTDMLLLCRMIGMHSNQNIRGEGSTRLFVEGRSWSVDVVKYVNIGQNVKCLCLVESMKSSIERMRLSVTVSPGHFLHGDSQYMKHLESLDSQSKHLVLAFNWFSPQSMWDYVSLGFEIKSNAKIESQESVEGSDMLGTSYLQRARQFLEHKDIREVLDMYLFGSSPNKSPGDHLGERSVGMITCTGFSFGAAISHAFAFLLQNMVRSKFLPTDGQQPTAPLSISSRPPPIRVVGFGSPKPGNSKFSKWFKKNLTKDSMNVILYARQRSSPALSSDNSNMLIMVDPVCASPPTISGFAMHPNCFLLNQEFGTLRRLCASDSDVIISMENQGEASANPFMRVLTAVVPNVTNSEISKAWDCLHGLLKYYEGMHGIAMTLE